MDDMRDDYGRTEDEKKRPDEDGECYRGPCGTKNTTGSKSLPR